MPKITNTTTTTKKNFVVSTSVEDDDDDDHDIDEEEEDDDDDESSMGPKKMISTSTTTKTTTDNRGVPTTTTTTTTPSTTNHNTNNHDMNNMNNEDSYYFEREMNEASNMMDRLFLSCSDDPKGSIHRAWGISLLFVIVYFTISILEMWNLHKVGSIAIVIATIITGVCHLLLGILGTFVLKRFPTSFSIGFLLGMITILFNQNLLFFGTFYSYDYGTSQTNHIFGSIGLVLSLILLIFGTLLFHFKQYIIAASPLISSTTGQPNAGSVTNNNKTQQPATTTTNNTGVMMGGDITTPTTNYQKFDDKA